MVRGIYVVEKEWLENMILVEKKTYSEIGKLIGRSPASVGIYAKKYGIKVSDRKVKPTKEELQQLYAVEHLPIKEIAKRYKLGLKTVRRLLLSNGFDIKPSGSNQFETITYSDVAETFKSSGCELLSKKYNNAHALLTYRCSCGNTAKISFSAFKGGQRCRKCGSKKMANSQKHSYEFVKNYFESKGCKLLSKEYKNTHAKLDYICHCGSKASMSFGNFQAGYDCSNCKRLRFLGANNHNYNPGLSDYDRKELGRYEERYKAFRKTVYRRDRYSCVICGESKNNHMVAHHLDCYSNFPEKRTDPNNAVTLCEDCHKDFHGKYGYKNNTREQFEEYKQQASID